MKMSMLCFRGVVRNQLFIIGETVEASLKPGGGGWRSKPLSREGGAGKRTHGERGNETVNSAPPQLDA